jgi:hypothetical protein
MSIADGCPASERKFLADGRAADTCRDGEGGETEVGG